MALTPESIAQTWANSGTVQIETAADYNVFVTYINSNPTAASMRNAEITADLDFNETDFIFFTGIAYQNITLDGNSHSLKNIVKKDILSANTYLFAGSADNAGNVDNVILQNLTFENVYITKTVYFCNFRKCTLQNVHLKNCRFVINGSNGYVGVAGCIIDGFSSAVTVLTGFSYIGVRDSSGSRIALLDTVTGLGSGNIGVYAFSNNSNLSRIFTRNRFYNFFSVTGIEKTATMSYVAITAENATVITPLGFSNPQTVATYYDNTLVPNASSNTQAGLPTATLKSVAAMQQHGFNVEAV